ncbi:hypothetical protein [Parvularcula sp. LCG005]|uniref:hypothetical protein n=1 Tax=Parvularcula sp. LCG005 TaxID=3078805 RepID=UPI0029424DF2|nr:hypothetical protein [Parvularcula sp. LCG005]WOI53569.1 hypothetical protein RUI03_00910 [Parvularcula sp. LCG005]
MAGTFLKSMVSGTVLAIALNGCATVGQKSGLQADQVQVVGHSETTGMDPIAAAAYWGTRYDRTPTDPAVAVAFSKALRAVDNNEESLRVIRHASVRVPDNAELLLEMGKSLIANDRAHEALRPIEQAIALGKSNDWSAFSAYGVALDKVGEHKQAQLQYDRALSIAPDKAQILNNKGLSYALDGRKDLAEMTLRTATSNPGGTARIRQNFALVLAMSGKTAEAERLARSDLPPSIADNNVSYYRTLVAQPVYWQNLEGGNVDLPDFGDDPAGISTTPMARPIPDPADAPRIRQRPAPTPEPKPAPADETAPGASAAADDDTPITVASR